MDANAPTTAPASRVWRGRATPRAAAPDPASRRGGNAGAEEGGLTPSWNSFPSS